MPHPPHLFNFFVPLFTNILPYAQSKWKQYHKKLEEMFEEALKVESTADEASERLEADPLADRDAAAANLEDARTDAALRRSELEVNEVLCDSCSPIDFSGEVQ